MKTFPTIVFKCTPVIYCNMVVPISVKYSQDVLPSRRLGHELKLKLKHVQDSSVLQLGSLRNARFRTFDFARKMSPASKNLSQNSAFISGTLSAILNFEALALKNTSEKQTENNKIEME